MLLALARYAMAEEAIAEGLARLAATAEPLSEPRPAPQGPGRRAPRQTGQTRPEPKMPVPKMPVPTDASTEDASTEDQAGAAGDREGRSDWQAVPIELDEAQRRRGRAPWPATV